jgi:hypothetical protein
VIFLVVFVENTYPYIKVPALKIISQVSKQYGDVGVGVLVNVCVGVGVLVRVCVGVKVGVGVNVCVSVGVGVGVVQGVIVSILLLIR